MLTGWVWTIETKRHAITAMAAVIATVALAVMAVTLFEQAQKTKRECYRAAESAGQIWACQ